MISNYLERGGGGGLIHVKIHRSRKSARSGLEKLVLKYVMIVHILTLNGNQYYFFKNQQQTDMAFSLKVIIFYNAPTPPPQKKKRKEKS